MLPKYLKDIFAYGCCNACRYVRSCNNVNPKFWTTKLWKESPSQTRQLRAGYCAELAAIFRFVENKIDTGDFIDDYIFEHRNKS